MRVHQQEPSHQRRQGAPRAHDRQIPPDALLQPRQVNQCAVDLLLRHSHRLSPRPLPE